MQKRTNLKPKPLLSLKRPGYASGPSSQRLPKRSTRTNRSPKTPKLLIWVECLASPIHVNAGHSKRRTAVQISAYRDSNREGYACNYHIIKSLHTVVRYLASTANHQAKTFQNSVIWVRQLLPLILRTPIKKIGEWSKWGNRNQQCLAISAECVRSQRESLPARNVFP